MRAICPPIEFPPKCSFVTPSSRIRARSRAAWATPPEIVCDLPTAPQAALIYRLSGDDNPLHVEPAVARAAGFARPILLPSALALFLAVLSLPLMVWLRNHRVPKYTAILIPVGINVAVVGLLITLASGSVSELQRQLPTYLNTLAQLQTAWTESIEARTDVIVSEYLTLDLIDPAAVLGLAALAACWIPARAALRLDPMAVLRDE